MQLKVKLTFSSHCYCSEREREIQKKAIYSNFSFSQNKFQLGRFFAIFCFVILINCFAKQHYVNISICKFDCRNMYVVFVQSFIFFDWHPYRTKEQKKEKKKSVDPEQNVVFLLIFFLYLFNKVSISKLNLFDRNLALN